MNTSTSPVSKSKQRQSRLKSKAGWSTSDIMIGVMILGLLGAIVGVVWNNVRGTTVDNTKITNADTMNGMMTAIQNHGIDASGWDKETCITNLSNGVLLPPTDAAASATTVKLDKPVNPAAYNYTAATATTAAVFTPVLKEPSVKP